MKMFLFAEVSRKFKVATTAIFLPFPKAKTATIVYWRISDETNHFAELGVQSFFSTKTWHKFVFAIKDDRSFRAMRSRNVTVTGIARHTMK